MEKIFTVTKDPYDANRELFSKEKITISSDKINCFVGANGTGKTTIIRTMIERLRKDGVLDLHEKLTNPLRGAFDLNDETKKKDESVESLYLTYKKDIDNSTDFDTGFFEKAFQCQTSTGEYISHNYGNVIGMLGSFSKAYKQGKYSNIKYVYLFLDDCDAGTSIDVIQDIKDVFSFIQEDFEKLGLTLFIIVTANSYEMCHDLNCISVHDFSNLQFNTYEEFKKFVLESRDIKNKQLKEGV